MKRWLIIAALCIGVIAVISIGVRSMHTVPPHQLFGKGDCAECHKNPPKYHTDNNWRINHGRTKLPVEARCATCHERSSCIACHALAPATHTSDFRNPGTSGRGAERHIIVGRAQPDSCLACHRNFTATCTRCHTVNETREWKTGRKALQKWRIMLGE